MGKKDGLQIAVIDYGMGNLFSVKQACEYAGLKPIITANESVIMNSDAIILPGVGSFGVAMDNLCRLGLVQPVKDVIESGKPFMGICLGMQLLLSGSDEFGESKGLGIIEGTVVKFACKIKEKNIKVPQVGWNQISQPPGMEKDSWDSSPLRDICNGEFMYFVHSYYSIPENDEVVFSTTNYQGIEYCSSISRKNVFAFQFHPEKSGVEGLKIYRNWATMIRG
jgi:glutamine amidotransferase